MPHHIPAAVLIQLDQPHVAKQEILCFEYALTTSLVIVGKTFETLAALSMVRAGTVKAIITAVDPRGSLADDLVRLGGQLHIVRQAAVPRRRDDLEHRILRSGLDTQQIARLLLVPAEEVRRRRRNRRE